MIRLFSSASFAALVLFAGCNRQDIPNDFNENEHSFFQSNIEVLDLDGDGQDDDSITSFTLFVSEEKDACDSFETLGFGLDDFFSFAKIVQVRQQHLNATNVPFLEGDITGGPLFDDQGTPLDGAASVTTLFRNSQGPRQQFSAGLGLVRFEKLRERSANVSVVDELVFRLDVSSNGQVSAENISEPVEGSTKRAKRCDALSSLGIIGLE